MAIATFVVLVVLEGCGPSRGTLDRLAAAGLIDERAPVTTHMQVQIDAPAAGVWALLINVNSWPEWQKQVESATASGPLETGMRFSWRTGGTEIHARVQSCISQQRLTWTGSVFTATAIHVWELKPEAGGRTLVVVKESVDGPLIGKLYSARQLAESGNDWLQALKKAAERTR